MSLYAVIGGAIILLALLVGFMARARRSGRNAERVKTTERANAIKTEQLDAAARRPRDADELRRRMREGEF